MKTADVDNDQKSKGNNALLQQEEQIYQQNLREHEEALIKYFNDMERAGYLNSYEKRLIKLGIVFKAIK